MKFGKYLEQAIYEAWRSQYVDYERLKELLEAYFDPKEGDAAPPSGYGSFDDKEAGPGAADGSRPRDMADAIRLFRAALDSELEKVNAHTQSVEAKLERSFRSLSAEMESLRGHESEVGAAVAGSDRKRGAQLKYSTRSDIQHQSEAWQHVNASSVRLYRRITLLNNYIYINRIAFDKIAKKFQKAVKGMKKASAALLSGAPQPAPPAGSLDAVRLRDVAGSAIAGGSAEKIKINFRDEYEMKVAAAYFTKSSRAERLLKDTASMFAREFESGDVSKARVRLLAKMSEGTYNRSQMLRLGFRIGVAMTLLLWNAFNLFVSPNLHLETGLGVFIPLYRAVAFIVALVWMWGFSVWMWRKYRVNHIFIFEISARQKLNYLEIWDEAASMTIVFLLNSLLLIHHQQYNLRTELSEVVYPVSLIVYILLKAFGSGGFCPRNADEANMGQELARSAGNVVIAPFGRARFRDCFLADFFCSMQLIWADLQYTICMYAAYLTGWFGFSHPGAAFADSAGYCVELSPVVMPIIHALPFFFRFNQCLKRYVETRKRFPNLANATKYMLCQLSVIIGSLHPIFSQSQGVWSGYRLFWLGLIVITTLYTWVWDVWMDWGLVELSPGAAHPLLRKKRLYPRVSVYYWAIASDFIFRFMWVVTLIPFPFKALFFNKYLDDHSILMATLTLAELLRRAQWGVLRVEFEHLSSSQGFRKYNRLPLFFDKTEQKKDAENATPWWMKLEVLFMAFLLIFFSVVVWVVR